MIRSVAYGNAVLAGMAGAVAWEIVARALIWAGVLFFDIVGTLGTVVLPDASPWASWGLGFLLHLVVGAIWAVFYAYFFWSALPVRHHPRPGFRLCADALGNIRHAPATRPDEPARPSRHHAVLGLVRAERRSS